MKFIIDIIKGMLVGIANVIPGVSGGTMAVSLGIYDRFVGGISNIFKKFKESVISLLPIVIGCGLGVVIFSKSVDFLLAHFPFATAMAFSGLILGGVPAIWLRFQKGYQEREKKNVPVHVLLFVIFVGISILLPLLNGGGDENAVLVASPLLMVKMLVAGVVAAATMIIPGVSGSLMLMIMGLYFGVVGAVNLCVDALLAFDMGAIWQQALVLGPFAIGCILGLFFVAKLIEWLFKKYETYTFAAIFGLVLTSPFAIFYKVNEECGLSATKVPEIIVGVVILLACMIGTYMLGKWDEKQETTKQKTEK